MAQTGPEDDVLAPHSGTLHRQPSPSPVWDCGHPKKLPEPQKQTEAFPFPIPSWNVVTDPSPCGFKLYPKRESWNQGRGGLAWGGD